MRLPLTGTNNPLPPPPQKKNNYCVFVFFLNLDIKKRRSAEIHLQSLPEQIKNGPLFPFEMFEHREAIEEKQKKTDRNNCGDADEEGARGYAAQERSTD